MANFARDILPLLLVGGAFAGKQMLGGGNPLTAQETAQNNDIWKNLGAGRLPNGAESTAMTGAPMQLPGATQAAAPAAMPARPPMPAMNPLMGMAAARQMPREMAGGQMPPMLGASDPQLPMMAQGWNRMQPGTMDFAADRRVAQQWADPGKINYGLLGGPNGRLG